MSKEIIKKYCDVICKKENLENPKISLRHNTRNSWGLCYNHLENNKIISLNKIMLQNHKLIKKYCDVDLFDVLLHEIAHLKFNNSLNPHNKDFWNYYEQLLKKYSKTKKDFYKELDDDFNTPEAMAVLFDLANEVNKTKSVESVNLLKNLGGVLGLLERSPDEFLQGSIIGYANVINNDDVMDGKGSVDFADETINEFIVKRAEAKKSKNFAEADRIRKQLLDNGIVLEDTPQGTTWRRA